LCPPPTDYVSIKVNDPEGSDRRPLQGREIFRWTVAVGFTYGYSRSSPSGSGDAERLTALGIRESAALKGGAWSFYIYSTVLGLAYHYYVDRPT